MTSDRTTVSLKDVKAFLPQVNCQMSKPRLKEAFHEVDARRLGELSFDEFASLYHVLIYDDNVFLQFKRVLIFKVFILFSSYRYISLSFANIPPMAW